MKAVAISIERVLRSTLRDMGFEVVPPVGVG
jgi:hypothetical protein